VRKIIRNIIENYLNKKHKQYLIELYEYYSFQVESIDMEMGYNYNLTDEEFDRLELNCKKYSNIRRTLAIILQEKFNIDIRSSI